MSKKVAVQKELNDIKSELKNSGYEVFDIEDGEAVEAIIYMADGYTIPYNNQLINMIEKDSIYDNQSVLLINATGRTSEQIKKIIDNRIYSPLFE